MTVFVCPPSSGSAGAVGSGVQSPGGRQHAVPPVPLSAAAIAGLTGSEGHVLALQNRGHRGFRLAPSKQGRGAHQGRPGKVPGDQARSDPFLDYTRKQRGDMAALQEALGFGGTGVLSWVVLFSSSTGDSHCHCWPQ